MAPPPPGCSQPALPWLVPRKNDTKRAFPPLQKLPGSGGQWATEVLLLKRNKEVATSYCLVVNLGEMKSASVIGQVVWGPEQVGGILSMAGLGTR